MIKFLGLVFIFVSQITWAGAISSGGGKGVVCRDEHNQIKSVELLDLWEARVLYRRTIEQTTTSVEEKVKLAAQRLQYSFYQSDVGDGSQIYTGPQWIIKKMMEAANLFIKLPTQVQFLKGVTLTPTQDSLEAAIPSDCSLEQIVTYIDTGDEPQVLVNQDLYDKMDDVNKAALITHEAFYSQLRGLGEMNSVRVRRSVGYVFSGQSFPDRKDLLKNSYLICSTDATVKTSDQLSYIYFYKTSEGKYKALPIIIWGVFSVGFFEEKYSTIDPKDDSFCKLNPPQYPNQVAWFTVPGAGPVDFTQKPIIAIACTSDLKQELYMSRDTFDPNNPNTTQKLNCWEGKSKSGEAP